MFAGLLWDYNESRKRNNRKGGENVENYVITIARGYGSGGKQIGELVSAQLGIPCYESQIPAMASECSGISQEKFVQVDERLRRPKLLRALQKAPDIDQTYGPNDRKFVSDDNLFNIQAWIIQELARTRSCIIVGKCANYLLRDRHNVLSAYVEAPRGVCVDTVMNKLGVTEAQAHRLISKTDQYRADYYRYYTRGEDWTNPTLYDLTVNTGRLSYQDAARLIIQAARIKLGDDVLY